jgi:hypothetical protein
MTATERLFRGDKEEYLSMDDPQDYGDLIYQLSFKEAIEANPPIISDYKVITFGISEPEIEAVYNDNKFIQIKKEIDDIKAREFATALALRKSIKKLGIRNAISFHSSIRRANNFKAQQELISKIYPEYENLKAFHVSGNMPTNQRSSQMREFAESKGLMTNARCLTEGVDLPAIDCVVFTDPKKSKVDIVQAAGRALRLSPGKKFGYILIPLIIPENENATEAAKDTAFEEIVATIRALATQDSRIIEYLRAVSSGTIPKGGSPVDGITKINVLTKVNEEEFNKSIQLKVWDRVAFGNWRPYEEAKKYAQSLNLKSNFEWTKFYRKNKHPKDIPGAPYQVYKKKWEGWGVFLNTGRIYDINYPEYQILEKFIQRFKIKSAKNFGLLWRKNKFKNNNFYVTAKPDVRYKNKGWVSWQKFLGNKGRIYTTADAYSFQKFLKVCKKYNIKNSRDWRNSNRRKKDEKMPSAPDKFYKEWTTWQEVLNSNKGTKKNFLSFDDARKFARSLNFKNTKQWRNFVKTSNKPLNIPAQPQNIYKHQFKDYKDFLGYEKSFRKLYPPFNEIKKIVKKLKFTSAVHYMKNFNKNEKFRSILNVRPQSVYAKEWKSWPDFLGTSKKPKSKKP